jgi:hypothetical protein
MTLEYLLLTFWALMCIVLVVQDLRGRWIHLVPVLGLMAAGLAWAGLQGWDVLRLHVTVNLVFLVLVVGLTWGVLKLRHPGQPLLNRKIGLGDLLFFVAVIGWLGPVGYAVFFVSSLVLVLLFVGLLILLQRWRMDNQIPLAGLQAGYLLLYFPLYWHWQQQMEQLVL